MPLQEGPTARKAGPAPRHGKLRWLGWASLIAGAGALAVWWLADHRRGIRWAVKVVRDHFPDVTHLPPRDLAAWLADGARTAPMLLDSRSEDEFAVSHLAGAQRIDPVADSGALKIVAANERPIVVYCSAGYRGSQVARRLREAGAMDVANLEGGIFAWANEGFEVVRNGESVPEVHPFRRMFARLLRRDRRPGK